MRNTPMEHKPHRCPNPFARQASHGLFEPTLANEAPRADCVRHWRGGGRRDNSDATSDILHRKQRIRPLKRDRKSHRYQLLQSASQLLAPWKNENSPSVPPRGKESGEREHGDASLYIRAEP